MLSSINISIWFLLQELHKGRHIKTGEHLEVVDRASSKGLPRMGCSMKSLYIMIHLCNASFETQTDTNLSRMLIACECNYYRDFRTSQLPQTF
jgi:hypothetical protein